MNKLRIRAIALGLLTGKLAEAGLGYNQGTYGSNETARPDMTGRHCETKACIAGHAVAAYDADTWDRFMGNDRLDPLRVPNSATNILGLSCYQARALFHGYPLGFCKDVVTAKKAAAVLFHLAETGKVDWNYVELPDQVGDAVTAI